MSLESDIDALYKLPLSEFTAARNALAKRMGGDDGKRVKALVKPTSVPWIVNQLCWKARPRYDALLRAGAALRKAQIAALGGRDRDNGASLAKATAAHERALADAVRAAAQLATAAGERAATDHLSRMLEAVSLAPTHPPTRGRLTAMVQPAGFEALAGITPALRLVRPAATSARRTTIDTAPAARAPAAPSRAELAREARKRQRLEEQARRRRETATAEAKRALTRALAVEARAKTAVDRAYETLERVRNERRAAEHALRQCES